MKKLKNTLLFSAIILALSVILSSCNFEILFNDGTAGTETSEVISPVNVIGDFSLDDIPDYSGEPYVAVNGNVPYFTDDEKTAESYEFYGELDSLGRCTYAIACVGVDLMPTEKRGDIGSVHPSGWQSIQYDFVDGNSLYNRCHLIGFQLSGENANEKNLVTGTRYLNVQGMLPFENMVADYVKETESHVLYRVTPIFKDDELVCRGILMEAFSVEDNGDGILFNVYCYNVQPGVTIDYKTGESRADKSNANEVTESESAVYVINKNSKVFHIPSCDSVEAMKESNKETTDKAYDILVSEGYKPCSKCFG